jgi:hypothetical protein
MRYRLPLALVATAAGAASAAMTIDHTTAATMLGFSFLGMPAFALGGVLALMDIVAIWRELPCPHCRELPGSCVAPVAGSLAQSMV